MGAPRRGCVACLTRAYEPHLAVARGTGTRECKDTNFLIHFTYVEI
jgi:recombinational DNA repair protein (RecF pathway)